jgi:hypothetical protein
MTAAAWQARDTGAQATVVAPKGTGVLAGQVLTDTANPQPARRVTVKLEGDAGTSNRLVGTDDDGRFVFDRLPAGRFTLSATKPGFVPVFHGAKHPGRGPGIPVAIAEGARVDVMLKMLPGGVITGTITDGHGHPARAITVAAVEVRHGGGAAPVPTRAVTDDLGVYRIFSLSPGAYAVSALPRLVPASDGRGAPAGGTVSEISEAELRWARSGGSGPAPAPGRPVSYAPVFYPGTPDPSAAATVQVASGEERSGVDMALRLVAMSRIAGKLLDASGQPVSPATVSLFPRHTGKPSPVDVLVSSGALVLPRAVVSSTSFAFTGVAPGEYTVVARSGSGGRATVAAAQSGPAPIWSVTELTVDGNDRTDVVLTLLPGLVVSGSLVFERTSLVPPIDLSAVEVTLAASPAVPGVAAAPRAVVAPAGTFRFASVAPGRYVLRAEPPASAGARWTLKSAMMNNRDLADRPVEATPGGAELTGLVVTFTDNAAEVAGRLIDASGQPVTDYSIVVFTADKTLWLPNARRIRAVRPATDGAFTVAGLPAGDYLIAAAEDVEPSDLADPAFLERLHASAISVTLREGEKKRQDLTTMRFHEDP